MARAWGLAARTVLASFGLVAVVFGAVEVAIALRGEGGRMLLGLAVFFGGLVLVGIPVVHGMRQAIEAARRGER